MPQGRHSEYTPEIGAKICKAIANGSTLIKAAESVGYAFFTVARWSEKYPDFNVAYSQARETQAETLADQIVALADDESLPPESRRIRVEARKWVASKLKPKRYGDRTILAGDKDNPLELLAVRLDTAIASRKMIDVTPRDDSDLL